MSKRNIIIVLAVAIVLVVVLVFTAWIKEIETLPVLIEEEEMMIPEFSVEPVEEVIEQEFPIEGEEVMPAN